MSLSSSSNWVSLRFHRVEGTQVPPKAPAPLLALTFQFQTKGIRKRETVSGCREDQPFRFEKHVLNLLHLCMGFFGPAAFSSHGTEEMLELLRQENGVDDMD